MALKTKAYIGLAIASGAALLAHDLSRWASQDTARFICYLLVAAIASCLKVRLPAITGTLSVNFLFILIGIAELSRPETLVLGCSAILVQCFWRARLKPQPVQVLFNVACIAIAIGPADAFFRWQLPRDYHLVSPLLLALASGVLFVGNTLPVAGVIALTEGKFVGKVWKDNYLWSFPYYLVGAAIAWVYSAVSTAFGWQTSLLILPAVYVIYRSYQMYLDRLEEEKRRAQEEKKHAEEIAALHLRTIETLALAIEAKDQTTGEHLQRVQTYAIEVGKELGLNATELEALRAASVLHDIGKLAVPEYIISKPGKLTPEEFEKMKIHPVVGAEIIEQVQFPYPVAPIVRAHHEKWDGSGYPAGLSGEAIPIGARILTAVDCLDALATDRQYRRALPLDEAIGIVVKESGKAFDPQVVEILARRYQELEQMAKQAGEVSHLPKAKLSVDLKIERGNAPDAGFESAGKSAATDQELIELAKHLAEASGVDATLPALTERLKRAVPYDALAVYVRRENQLAPAYVSGKDFRLFSSLEIPVGQGLSGWVAENRKPIVNGNPSVEPGYLNDPTRFSRLRSALAAPLELQGRLVGVLALYHGGKDAFTREHLLAVEAIAPRLAAAIEETARPAVAGREVA